MQLDLGGPVWHASIGSFVLPHRQLEARARALLDGVGDPLLGEWVEESAGRGRLFVHVRRRLSAAEQVLVGDVVDIRGAPEQVARRLGPVRHLLPPGYSE